MTACRLCAKAVQQGLRVIVYAPDASLIEQFDQLLWTFSVTSFIPHCRNDDDVSLVQQTPVIFLVSKTPTTAQAPRCFSGVATFIAKSTVRFLFKISRVNTYRLFYA